MSAQAPARSQTEPAARAGHRYRLAIVTSHPIQYQAPLFRKLAQHPQIDLTVYFCTNYGVTERVDPGFGVAYKWDIPLLEGYSYKFLRNLSFAPSPNGFWRSVNPGILGELWRRRYDAILLHGYAQATNWLALLGASLRGTPLLLHGETLLHARRGALGATAKRVVLKVLFSRVKAYLAIGKKSREFYRFYGVPESQLFLAPYSVDNDFFFAQAQKWRARKGELKASVGIPDELPVVLYASKMTPRKRPMDCLKAFERLGGKAALVFVGDGELRPALEAYTRERAIRNVQFVGFKNQSELPRFYSMGDIFVFPSSYETWGLVINEAMCFGLPVVTTDGVAASYDLVREGGNGFVYPVGDVDLLTERLGQLASDAELRCKMGQQSAEMVSSWSYDACVEGVLEALEHATGKPAG